VGTSFPNVLPWISGLATAATICVAALAIPALKRRDYHSFMGISGGGLFLTAFMLVLQGGICIAVWRDPAGFTEAPMNIALGIAIVGVVLGMVMVITLLLARWFVKSVLPRAHDAYKEHDDNDE